jgi:hypothetical protein
VKRIAEYMFDFMGDFSFLLCSALFGVVVLVALADDPTVVSGILEQHIRAFIVVFFVIHLIGGVILGGLLRLIGVILWGVLRRFWSRGTVAND